MNLYSQMVGSFYRTGNYPLEANYVFRTLDDLKEFYSDEIEKATLHKGLLKIVEDDGNGKQALYWVTKKLTNDELEFSLLASGDSLQDVLELLDDLETKLNQEIEDRKLADDAIWGTEDRTLIPDDLNSIKDLSEAVSELNEKAQETLEQLKAVVGTEWDDIISYLQTLPLGSLTKVSIALHKFLETVDKEDPTISTLPEIQHFLAGYTDSDNLHKILHELVNSILGDPLPDEDYNTLRDLENAIKSVADKSDKKIKDLQDEIDETQKGVGLENNGRFSPDAYTHYLKEATSVMNALRTLDQLLYEAMTGVNLEPEDTDTVDMTVLLMRDKTIISAKVKLSSNSDNLLQKKDDGLYYDVDILDSDGRLDLIVNGNVVKSIYLGLDGLVEDGYYDSENESIVIVLRISDTKTRKLTIPVHALIEEWEILNDTEHSVLLSKERNINGKDVLAGDVKISTNNKNILKKDANGRLLVKGTADNITMTSGETVESAIKDINSNITDYNLSITSLKEALNSEISRAEKKEHEIEDLLANEINRAVQSESTLQSNIDLLNSKVETSLTNIESLLTKTSELSEELTKEIHNREISELDLNNLISNLDSRITANESNISDLTNKSTQLNDRLTEEVNRAKEAEHALEDLVKGELNRAELVESGLLSSIDTINEKIQSLGSDKISTIESSLLELTNDYNAHKVLVEKDKAEINQSISQEESRAVLAEQNLLNSIDAITERLNSNFDSDKSVTENLTLLNEKLSKEISDRQLSEQDIINNVNSLDDKLEKEITRATQAEAQLTTIINGKVSSVTLHKDNDRAYTIFVDGQEIGTIEIPSQAIISSVTYDDETGVLEIKFVSSELSDVRIDLKKILSEALEEVVEDVDELKTEVDKLKEKDVVEWNDTTGNKAIYLEKDYSISAKFENSDTRTPILLVIEDKTHLGSNHFPSSIDSSVRPEVNENGTIYQMAYLEDIELTVNDYITSLELRVAKLELIIKTFEWNYIN